jgi:hypothetical protein
LHTLEVWLRCLAAHMFAQGLRKSGSIGRGGRKDEGSTWGKGTLAGVKAEWTW